MCLETNIRWEARKNKRGQDIRVNNPKLPNLRMFKDFKEEEIYSVIRVTSRIYC